MLSILTLIVYFSWLYSFVLLAYFSQVYIISLFIYFGRVYILALWVYLSRKTHTHGRMYECSNAWGAFSSPCSKKYVHVEILGTDSTSFTYGWVRNGYLLGTMVLYLDGFYLRSSDIFLISQNNNRFEYSRCARSTSSLCTQKPMDVNCCKIWSLCVDDHIISSSKKHLFYFLGVISLYWQFSIFT